MPTVATQTDMIVEKKSQRRFTMSHKINVNDANYQRGYKDGTNEIANKSFYDEQRLLTIIENLQIENVLLRTVKS